MVYQLQEYLRDMVLGLGCRGLWLIELQSCKFLIFFFSLDILLLAEDFQGLFLFVFDFPVLPCNIEVDGISLLFYF